MCVCACMHVCPCAQTAMHLCARTHTHTALYVCSCCPHGYPSIPPSQLFLLTFWDSVQRHLPPKSLLRHPSGLDKHWSPLFLQHLMQRTGTILIILKLCIFTSAPLPYFQWEISQTDSPDIHTIRLVGRVLNDFSQIPLQLDRNQT